MARDAGLSGPPRVIIIGGGLAGLATGCYAQMSGMRTQIFEKHVLPGGCCTAWGRQGYILDYCIEWLLGTGSGNDANQVWRELGALDGKKIADFEIFNRVVDSHGRSVTFYNDPGRLERHLLSISPADAPLIRSFCRDLRRFAGLDLYPFLTPPPLRTPRERLRLLAQVLPEFRLFWRTASTPMHAFAGRFADPLLRRAFCNIFFQDHEVFPLLPYLFNLAAAHRGNAGFPQGGSLGLARSVAERYTSLGGAISYRAAVERIEVRDGRAVGVLLRNGTRHYADHVVSACDGRTTIYRLLGGRYTSPRIDRLYTELLDRPGVLYPGVVSVFVGLDGEIDPGEPHSTTYLLSAADRARLPGSLQGSLVVQIRSRYCAELAPPGKSLIHCTYFSDYGYWKTLRGSDRAGYRERKRQVSGFVLGFLERWLPGTAARAEVIDVATPATTERYTGNLNGSILAWMAFSDADSQVARLIARDRMRLPGLAGFSMAGQWVSGGGLIRAASSGRFAVQFLCAELGLPFTAAESAGGRPWQRDQLGELPLLDPDRRPARAGRRPA